MPCSPGTIFLISHKIHLIYCSETENGFACQQSRARILSAKNEHYARQTAHFKGLKRINVPSGLFSNGMGILFIYFSKQGFGPVYDFVFLPQVGFTVYAIVAQLANMIIFSNRKKINNVKVPGISHLQ